MNFTLENAAITFIVALLGMVMGSFNTVLCYRIPREIPLGLTSHGRSRCTQCNGVIPWYQNVPVFAWLALRGKCSKCKAPIPARYLWIELSTTLIFVVTYWVYELSPNRPLETFAYWAELAKLLWFGVALIATVFIDLEFRIIPDRFSLGGWIIALAAALFWQCPSIESALAGGAFGAGVFFMMAWGYEKLKGVEGLGMGDVKMMGWLGSWVGMMGVPFVILAGSLTGLAAGLIAMRTSKEGFKTAIPFGPFLAFGGYLAWVIGALGYW